MIWPGVVAACGSTQIEGSMSEQKLRRASLGLHATPGVRPSPEEELHSPIGGTESLASSYGVALLEHRLALLHGTDSAVVTSDRLSALALVVSHLMVPGDNMVCADQIRAVLSRLAVTTSAPFGLNAA